MPIKYLFKMGHGLILQKITFSRMDLDIIVCRLQVKYLVYRYDLDLTAILYHDPVALGWRLGGSFKQVLCIFFQVGFDRFCPFSDGLVEPVLVLTGSQRHALQRP